VALEVPSAQRRALAAHLDACRAAAPGLRWVEPENLHLTLRFLGHLAATTLEELAAELPSIDVPPFRIALDGCGTFGPTSAPRVVWIAVGEGAEACGALAARVESLCRKVGLEPEARPFKAHVTLARARGEGPAPRPGPAQLPEPPRLAPWRASEFVLFESRLGPRGATYVPMRRFPLP
jgi:2'-5' RNA ligase